MGWWIDTRSNFLQADNAAAYNLALSSLQLAGGFALFFLARPIGKWIGAGVDAPAPAIDVEKLVAAGAFLVGIVLLIEFAPNAIMRSINIMIEWRRLSDADRMSTGLPVYYWQEIARSWLAVILAFALTWRARDVARLFGWLRAKSDSIALKPREPSAE